MYFRHSFTLLAIGLVVLTGCSRQPAPDDGTKSFQGTWDIMDATGAKTGKQAIFEKDTFQVQSFAQEKEEAKATIQADEANNIERSVVQIDLTQTPPHITLVPIEGLNNGKPRDGIFEFEGDDKIKICVAHYELPRPTDFNAGSKTTLLILQRAK